MNLEKELYKILNFILIDANFYQFKNIDKNSSIKLCVNTTHVLNAIDLYQKKHISKKQLVNWVNFIWFSEMFYYDFAQEDCIASVMTEIETWDEFTEEVLNEKIEFIKSALLNNQEI